MRWGGLARRGNRPKINRMLLRFSDGMVELFDTKPKQNDDDDGATRPPDDSANECLSGNIRLPLFCISNEADTERVRRRKVQGRRKGEEWGVCRLECVCRRGRNLGGHFLQSWPLAFPLWGLKCVCFAPHWAALGGWG